MRIKGYELINDEKYDRAINGAIGREGKAEGGVGEEATDELKLAAYDRLGGLILKNGRKVKTGCFCDLAASKKQDKIVAIENPKVILVLNDLAGNKVEIGENEELPIEVQAFEKITEKKKDETMAEIDKRRIAKEEKIKKARNKKRGIE